MNVIEVMIAPDGNVRLIYSDAMAMVLGNVGTVAITRASNVEPDASGRWVADMAPVGGPKLGPFSLRCDALAAEVAWLLAHGTPVPRDAAA